MAGNLQFTGFEKSLGKFSVEKRRILTPEVAA